MIEIGKWSGSSRVFSFIFHFEPFRGGVSRNEFFVSNFCICYSNNGKEEPKTRFLITSMPIQWIATLLQEFNFQLHQMKGATLFLFAYGLLSSYHIEWKPNHLISIFIYRKTDWTDSICRVSQIVAVS